MVRPAVATAVLSGVDAAAILRLHATATRFARELPDLRHWLADVGPDRALAASAGAALWLVAVWLGAGLLVALAAGLPGVVGRAAQHLSGLLLPRALHRVLVGSAGLGVLLAPVAAGAAPAPGPPAPTTASIGSAVPAPAWPVDAHPDPDPPPIAAPLWPGAPAPAEPNEPPAPAAPASPAAPTTPDAPPAPAPAAPAAPAPSHTTPSARPSPAKQRAGSKDRARTTEHAAAAGPPAAAHQTAVTVAPGDSLWLIAARRLGPEATPSDIAANWPRWYAANRAVIGADPALIRPGQLLRAPAAEEHPR